MEENKYIIDLRKLGIDNEEVQEKVLASLYAYASILVNVNV